MRRGREILSNTVASQIAVHLPYGGVVPELASREHLRNILPVVREALREAGVRYGEIDAVAVTEGPGLAGALLVGISFAKSLALTMGKPLIAVNHLEGHIHAVLLEEANRAAEMNGAGLEERRGPALALVVSGGHTHLYLAEFRRPGPGRIAMWGGRWTMRRARRSTRWRSCWGWGIREGRGSMRWRRMGIRRRCRSRFRRSRRRCIGRAKVGALNPAEEVYFSFSGIKTAMLRYTKVYEMGESIEARRAALAANGECDAGGCAAALRQADAGSDCVVPAVGGGRFAAEDVSRGGAVWGGTGDRVGWSGGESRAAGAVYGGGGGARICRSRFRRWRCRRIMRR